MAVKLSSSSMFKILVLLSVSTIVYKGASSPDGACRTATKQKLKNEIEKYIRDHVTLNNVALAISSGSVSFEKAFYDVVTLTLAESLGRPNGRVENELFDMRNLQELCRQLKMMKVKDDSKVSLSICLKAAEEVHDCVENHVDDLRPSYHTSDPQSFADLINRFQENRL